MEAKKRIIKFRAWIRDGEWDENGDEQAYVMVYDLAFEEYESINDLLNGIEHLMQYTGLKDKNGKEIYEGDILQCDTYYAIQKWWNSPKDIPKIEKEVEQQKKDTHKTKSVCEFRKGVFEIFCKPISKFLYFDSKKKIHLVQQYETGRKSGVISDNYEGWLNIEIIGNQFENPELIDKT